ncbi:concanavalin A-like lectin/glucanase domain-containing protein [Cercophora newfieldiana]|uniref:Concanavalin A-like lectin/glucanase domain-containing protein n=1 Tax=Cercophora newfieldiana TaxID=92897 RepID=A0AA40CHK8_9PEZI|nr:concanavalin A-like lectin/glucanase domain-containing protein [Cercophora newfieldiana]
MPIASLTELYAYWCGHSYEAINNLWGRDSAISGSQGTFVSSASDGGVAWSTTWTWRGAPNNVKSFPYAGRQFSRGKKIAGIQGMPTCVEWDYTGDLKGMRANVAYDIFTATDPQHANSGGDFELMIWLGRYGDVCPIGSSAGCVKVAGRNWDLWVGYNGQMKVYSFLPPAGAGAIKSFSADVREFFRYLEECHQFPASQQNLIVFQAGTECFTGGPATFTCSRFSADVIDAECQ